MLFRRLAAAALLIIAPSPTYAQAIRMVAVVDGSGTTSATAGTSQQALPRDETRTWLFCQNPITATTPLFVNFGAAASTTGGSIELAPGGTIGFTSRAVPIMTINVASATASARYVCKSGS